MANSTIAIPHSPESEKRQEDESLGGVGDPALLFYGPPCRPADYKELEDCPPSILKTPKVEECCKTGEGAIPEKECKRIEAKAEKEVKCRGCRGKDESTRGECPIPTSKIFSDSVVRFTEAGRQKLPQALPIQTVIKETYCNGVLTHRETTDCRPATDVSNQQEGKGKELDKKTNVSGAVEPSSVEKSPKKSKASVATPFCEPGPKAEDPKKGRSLIPVMNNLMSMMRETEVNRLKINRMRERTTLNTIQGIAQWFLVSQTIAMMVFLVLGIVFLNVFGLLFVVVLFSRR
ncbi:hypothetical protein QFC22_001297 [Naganishia vaughanmartiniae]|uniref:Uncharacterized protein n=1 Tax=Naganishia vaughanmartiniae TaxID=1424756 RepID=A0ACC2XK58_9TREE|nr:hypothetical protein QFC22_001297 [Naganishia vaughanmartiniae]